MGGKSTYPAQTCRYANHFLYHTYQILLFLHRLFAPHLMHLEAESSKKANCKHFHLSFELASPSVPACMSQSSHQRSNQPWGPMRTHNTGLLSNLLKIAALAAQAHSNPKFIEDNAFALKILRDARTVTGPWLEDVEQELKHYGVFNNSGRRQQQRLSKKPKTSCLLLLAKMAVMQLKTSKESEEADKRAWRIEMLKEMFLHLEAHIEDVESEIKRLERKVEGKNRKHEEHSRPNSGGTETNRGEGEFVDQSNDNTKHNRKWRSSSNLSHYRKQRKDKQEPQNRSHDEDDPKDSHELPRIPSSESGRSRGVPVNEGAQEHPAASVAGSMHSRPTSISTHGEGRSFQRYKQPYLAPQLPQNETLEALPSEVRVHGPQSAITDPIHSTPPPRSGVQPGLAPSREPGQHMPPPLDGLGLRGQAEPLAVGSSGIDAAGRPLGKTKTPDTAPHYREINTAAREDPSLDATNDNQIFENIQNTPPYDQPRTAAMPKAPSSVSDSQYSRQTRAPTGSSAHSSPTTIYAPVTPAISVTQPNNSLGTPGDSHPGIAVHHANPDTPPRTSDATSRVRKPKNRSDKPKATTIGEDNQSNRIRSSYATGQYSLQPDTSSVGPFIEESTPRNVLHAQAQSLGASQSTIKPQRVASEPRSASQTSTVLRVDVLPRPLPAQGQPAWGFGNLNESRVRPPSGMSCHAGSLAHSKAPSHGRSHTRQI